MFPPSPKTTLSLLLISLSSGIFAHGDESHSVAIVEQEIYQETCGECHMAYPAGLLPAASWKSLMSKQAVAEHFGEDLYLEDQERQQILRLLLQKAAHKRDTNKLSRKFARSALDAPLPLIQISKTRYHQKKHEDIPKSWVLDNPDVLSFSNCSACHGDKAEQGLFNEDDVQIPNFEDQDYD